VVALSEALFHELAGRGPHVGVSVLCPEAVDTRIADAERNRPAALRPAAPVELPERSSSRRPLARRWPRHPSRRDRRARVRGIRERRFYVLAEDAWRRAAELRCEDIRLARNPTFAPPV